MNTGKEMTNEDYHAAPGISSSQLKLLEESPLHLHHAHLFKFEQNESMAFGTLVHSMTLEPDTIDDVYIVKPNVDGRTKDGRDALALFEARAFSKTPVSDSDYRKAMAMAKNTQAIAGGLLIGNPEHSFFVEENGLTLKCRPDLFNPETGLVIDLKTTSDITETGLRKSMSAYRYDRQAAFYLKVLRLAGHHPRQFIFIFVSSTAPYLVKVRELSPGVLERADYEIEMLMESYTDYLASPDEPNLIKTIALFEEL